MDSGGTKRQMQVVFSGRVQGVGFPYTVLHASESFELTGFVRNLMDGNVEVVAEGFEQELSDFLINIRSSHVGRYVSQEQVRWFPATAEFDSFRILS